MLDGYSLILLVPIAIGGIVLHMVTGAAILAIIDNDDRDLYRWAASAPGGTTIALLIWPWIWWRWVRRRD